ncbi:zinc finger BED domain-containing protein 4-like [Bombina bombina]|uniref:zinc finger BED domain-containing protein 4-like n=1 Tax=Bombina bombina TaxID=8345 RepID=UPI00235AB866|nr:zinc finger BED domain-containing protein 4-like [Bombina bombina]
MASRKRRSSIWIHFVEVGPQKAKCKLCNNILSGQGGTTSNFRRHLQNKHPTALLMQVGQEDLAETIQATTIISTPSPKTEASTTSRRGIVVKRPRKNVRPPIRPKRERNIDEELTKMIALDLQPFSIVNDKGFRNFLKAIDPSYIFPNRKTLSAIVLPQLYDRIKAELMVKVSNASAVCLTTDCWTSQTNTSFMAVTCHYIDDNFKLVSSLLDCFSVTDNLANELKNICEEWGITNKVVACVSDNASNIQAAIRQAGWKHVACFAHSLNLIVMESLKHIQETVTKVRSVVQYVNTSTVATERLKATQRQMGFEELTLKQDVVTRWNSTYYMLKRFWEQKEPIIDILALVNPSLATLTLDEWDIIKETCEILKPFEEVTVEISADRYVTASKVILMARGLQKAVLRSRGAWSTHVPVIAMLEEFKEQMQNHFHQIEHFRLLAEATLLDPRFKQRAFHDTTASDEAAKSITTAAARLATGTHGHQPRPADAPASTPSEQSSFWEDFDERVADAVTLCNPTSTAMSEMRGYLADPLVPRSEDPLVWWKARESIYEGLTAIMRRRLCIVATSAPAERIFSKAGQNFSERRNRLSPNKVRQLVFLNANITTPEEKST